MHHPKPVEMPNGFRIRYLTSPLSRSEQQQSTTNPDKPMTETRYPGDDNGDVVIKGGVARYVAKTPFDRDEETGTEAPMHDDAIEKIKHLHPNDLHKHDPYA